MGMGQMENRMKEAQAALARNAVQAQACLHKPLWHISAKSGWINDPNGLIYQDGWYHVFFQHNPMEASPGLIFWGHVRSKDLVHWEHLPLALAPDQDYDRDGCWSGSAVVRNGRLVLLYSGHQEGRSPGQVQCLAESRDGIEFQKSQHNPVISEWPRAGSKDIRDPKVWISDGVWHMLLGSSFEGKGRVLLYTSTDLLEWKFRSVVLESDGSEGYMWECPDLFHLDGTDYLLVSPIGMENHRNIWFSGTFDAGAGVFIKKGWGDLDYGLDFYAAQTFLSSSGQRLLFAWMNYWNTSMPTQVNGHAGALTMPRMLLKRPDGGLGMLPAPHLTALRQGPAFLEEITVGAGGTAWSEQARGNALEIEAVIYLNPDARGWYGLDVLCDETGHEYTSVRWDNTLNRICLDASCSGVDGPKSIQDGPIDHQDGGVLVLRIFLDRSSVEVFAGEGLSSLTARVYPGPSSVFVRFINQTDQSARTVLKAWRLGQAFTPAI